MIQTVLLIAAMMLCLIAVYLLDTIYAMGAIVPIIMFLSGYWMYAIRLKPNHVAGYRTGMSMRNDDTWEFANHYCGMLWMKWGVPLLAVSELVLYFLQPSKGIAEWLLMLQLIPVIAGIPVTERALEQNFDRQGNRREEK